MSKVTLDPTKLFDLLKKEIQGLENRKQRLIAETDDLQQEVNTLAEKAASIKNILKSKEDELQAKYDKKCVELADKVRDADTLRAEVSAEKGELNKLIAQNKQMDIDNRRVADALRAEMEKTRKLRASLESVTAMIKKELI